MAVANLSVISDAADPRLDRFRDLKDAQARSRAGAFVAEGEIVVRRLLASPMAEGVQAVLLTAPRLRTLQAALPPELPVFLVPQPVIDEVAGINVHRGCLALGTRPRAPEIPAGARRVLVLEDLVDAENVGACFRNAAAFGLDAVVLSPRCADPFYRKAIRVSAGAVFNIPAIRMQRWPGDLVDLARRHELALVAAVVDGSAVPLLEYVPPARVALVVGSEGPGLSGELRDVCDALVTIPMGPAVDSLNVAVAAAVALYELSRPRGRAGIEQAR